MDAQHLIPGLAARATRIHMDASNVEETAAHYFAEDVELGIAARECAGSALKLRNALKVRLEQSEFETVNGARRPERQTQTTATSRVTEETRDAFGITPQAERP